MTGKESKKKVTPPDWYDERVTAKELADRIRYSVRFVRAMKRDGFPMPGRRASANQAFSWLAENPEFRVNRRQ